MFILPVDSTCSLLCVAISFVYESFRILAAYFATRPSDELRLLKIQKVFLLAIILLLKSLQQLKLNITTYDFNIRLIR
jgi:hypothetical protein